MDNFLLGPFQAISEPDDHVHVPRPLAIEDPLYNLQNTIKIKGEPIFPKLISETK